MPADHLGPLADACRLCGSDRLSQAAVLQGEPRVVLLECSSCRGCQASRFPDEAFLGRLYDSYYGAVDDAAPRITAASPGRVGARISSYARRFLSGAIAHDGARILDVGGGDGSIAVDVAARLGEPRRGWDVTVVEAGQSGWRAAGPEVRVTTVPDMPDAGRFPIVILSAVLEHVTDPMAILDAAVARLAAPGILYVRTPYVVPVLRIAERLGASVDFTYPAHLYDLGAPFWDRIGDWSSLLTPADRVVASRASPVEAGFRSAPTRAVISVALKQSGRVIPPMRAFSGGWEWVVARWATAG